MLGLAVVGKSLFLLAAFVITRRYSPLYCSPHCAMRLVNESDPAAYSNHPYWKDLQYDDSCAGDSLKEYVEHQNNNNERVWMDGSVNTWTFLGACLVLYSMVRGSFQLRAILAGLVSAVFALMGATVVLMHTHFEVDITFLSGGILHHAISDMTGINDKNNSVTEGYLYCGTLNQLFYTATIYFLITRDKRLKKYYNPILAIGLLQLLILLAFKTVGKMHPVYHEMAANGSTPELENAWPYTPAWRAYMHCIVHHSSGLSFSGDPFLDPIYDTFLYIFAFLHNQVFKISLGSALHFAFSTVADMVMGIMGVLIMYSILHIGAFFIPSRSGKAKTV